MIICLKIVYRIEAVYFKRKDLWEYIFYLVLFTNLPLDLWD